MAVQGLENLSVLKITKIVQALQDERMKQPRRLRFLSRTRRVPAMNGEMLARFIGRILIADLVAPDSAAGVYSSGKLAFESYQLPKIKIGRTLTESQVQQFNAIRTGQITGESQIMDFIGPIVDNCLTGCENRCEALIVAMYRNRLDYDRLGYKAEGVTWGMPSDLNITAAVPWTTAGSATPIDDLLSVVLLGRTRYGIEYDTVIGSTAAFRYAIATTEFSNKAKPLVRADLTWSTNFSQYSLGMQTDIFRAITGLTWEFNDDRYWYQNTDGSMASARYQPINELFLIDSKNDNNPAASDLAAGVPVEAELLGLNPSAVVGAGSLPIAGAGGTSRNGPIGYLTVPPDMNPPNVTLWGVDMAFPRRHLLQLNSVLNVGNFSDPIPVTEVTLV